jgi:hypothetical protein
MAAILRVVPIPARKTQATWWTIACWSLIGLSSGVAFIGAQQALTHAELSTSAIASLMFRSLVRYSAGGLLFQLARGYAAQAEADTTRLRESIQAQQSERLHVLDESDATDRMISEGLHRSIQGRLSAVVLLFRLDRRIEAITELEGVRTVTLPILLDRLRHPSLRPDGTSTTTSAPLLGIEFIDQVDWSEVELRSPTIVSDLMRVIDECLVNAQRHGQASQMVATASFTWPRLTLTCTDNGHSSATFGSKGLGSRIFDEVSRQHDGAWTLLHTDRGTELNLTLDTSSRDASSAVQLGER